VVQGRQHSSQPRAGRCLPLAVLPLKRTTRTHSLSISVLSLCSARFVFVPSLSPSTAPLGVPLACLNASRMPFSPLAAARSPSGIGIVGSTRAMAGRRRRRLHCATRRRPSCDRENVLTLLLEAIAQLVIMLVWWWTPHEKNRPLPPHRSNMCVHDKSCVVVFGAAVAN
jgi:hypothetical protein